MCTRRIVAHAKLRQAMSILITARMNRCFRPRGHAFPPACSWYAFPLSVFMGVVHAHGRGSSHATRCVVGRT